MTKKDEKGNSDKELTLENAISILSDQIVDEKDLEKHEKQVRLFLGWFNGLSVTKSAKIAGYSVAHASRLLQKYQKDREFRGEINSYFDALPDRFKNFEKLKLHQVGRIQQKALDRMEENPELAIKHRGILKDIMKVTGVLEEEAPFVPQVNIGKIQLINKQILDRRCAELGLKPLSVTDNKEG
jgi:hypothetical protein